MTIPRFKPGDVVVFQIEGRASPAQFDGVCKRERERERERRTGVLGVPFKMP